MDRIEKLEKRMEILEEKVLVLHKRSITNPYAGGHLNSKEEHVKDNE